MGGRSISGREDNLRLILEEVVFLGKLDALENKVSRDRQDREKGNCGSKIEAMCK